MYIVWQCQRFFSINTNEPKQLSQHHDDILCIKGETKAIPIWCACRSMNCRAYFPVSFSLFFRVLFSLKFVNENHFFVYVFSFGAFVVCILLWAWWQNVMRSCCMICAVPGLRVVAIYCVTLCILKINKLIIFYVCMRNRIRDMISS